MPATLPANAFTAVPHLPWATAVDAVGRALAHCQAWVEANRDVVAKCYVVLAADGIEVYPVAVRDPLGPEPSDRLAALLIALSDAGLPADGFVILDGPDTSLAAHFDPRRAIVVTPPAGGGRAV